MSGNRQVGRRGVPKGKSKRGASPSGRETGSWRRRSNHGARPWSRNGVHGANPSCQLEHVGKRHEGRGSRKRQLHAGFGRDPEGWKPQERSSAKVGGGRVRRKTSRSLKRRGRNEAAEARLRRGWKAFQVVRGQEQETPVTRWTHTDWLRWRGSRPQERKFNSAVALTEAAADKDRAGARSALRGS